MIDASRPAKMFTIAGPVITFDPTSVLYGPILCMLRYELWPLEKTSGQIHLENNVLLLCVRLHIM